MIDPSVKIPVENKNLFCRDLPSQPQPGLGKVLVTGASGYIGGRLVSELLARGYQVRVMVRRASPIDQELWPGAEIVVADALKIDQLQKALAGINTAYYLIHSLYLGPKEFEAADIKAAVNFRKAAARQRIKRIIYLGGLGDIRNPLSSHLRNRIEVAARLKRGPVPVTILRAAVIMGSGSASYEIIQHLVRKAPFLLIPHWAKSKCQPIAIRDIIKYLVGVLEIPQTAGQNFDVGGQDILTYEQMLKIWARVLRKKRIFISFTFGCIPFYAYLTSLLTPVPHFITQCLMEGLKNEVVCQDNRIKKILPFEPLSYKKSIVLALSREEQDQVSTRWSDAYPPAHELALKLHELKNGPDYTARDSLVTDKKASALFRSICQIGGREGWFHSNWMWWLRGGIDRILLGVGSSRGRKSHSRLKINDVIDFWRIEDLQPNKRLLLRAEMKLPGRAWLEFTIKEKTQQRELAITAYYQTAGIFGRLYWYLFIPFHTFIFKNLIVQIEKRS